MSLSRQTGGPSSYTRRAGRSLPPPLSGTSWQFFRLRPSNFPTARLAALCHLPPRFFGNHSFRPIIDPFASAGQHALGRIGDLHKLFVFVPDQFWKRHLHFFGTAPARGISIGRRRAGDIVINGIVPFALLYARVFRCTTGRSSALAVFRAHPPLQPNAITKHVQREILSDSIRFTAARQQQGALRLYRKYCLRGKRADCEMKRPIDNSL